MARPLEAIDVVGLPRDRPLRTDVYWARVALARGHGRDETCSEGALRLAMHSARLRGWLSS